MRMVMMNTRMKRDIMNRNVYSMEADDMFINGSNGKEVGEYLLSVGNISSIPERAEYINLSLLEEVDASLVK